MTIRYLAAAFILSSPLPAQPASQPAVIEGWWRAMPSHAGESSEFYLHFTQKDGKPAAAFSIPYIASHETPVGPYEISRQAVTMPAVKWTLAFGPDGRSLVGALPPELVPVHRMAVRFERSDAPPRTEHPAPLAAAPRPLWQARVDGPVYGPLAYDPGTDAVLVTTNSGTVVSLDPTTGKQRWSVRMDGPVRSAVTVAGSAAYIASDKSITKVNLGDGDRIWTAPFQGPIPPRLEIRDPASRWDHYGSAAIAAGDLVVAGSRDGCTYAVAARDGKLRRRMCAGDMIVSTPAVHDGRVFFASFDHHVYAADLGTGAIAWKTDLKEAVPGDLALAESSVLAGSRSYDFAALDVATGQPRWTRHIWFSWIDSAPVISGSQVFVGSSDAQRIFAIDANTGRPSWSTFLGGWTWARPVAGPRTVYAGAVGTSMRYVGPRAGGLAAMNRSDGSLMWLFRPASDPGALMSGFASGPVLARGRLFAADLEGKVYAFDAS